MATRCRWRLRSRGRHGPAWASPIGRVLGGRGGRPIKASRRTIGAVPFAIVVLRRRSSCRGRRAGLRRRRRRARAAAVAAAPLPAIIDRVERERGLTFPARPGVRTGHARAGARGGARGARRGLPAGAPRGRRRAARAARPRCRRGPTSARRGVHLRAGRGRLLRPALGRACGSSRAPRPADRVLYESTVAHELDHALEDQRFDFDLDAARRRRRRRAGLPRARRGVRDARVMTRYMAARFRPRRRSARRSAPPSPDRTGRAHAAVPRGAARSSRTPAASGS